MAKITKTYARRPAFREPYETVLIVCEGSKSEPNYLNALCVDKQLSTVNVKVVTSPGSDPLSVVRCAIEEDKKTVEQDRRAGEKREGYDRVYCVFDRIGHTNFENALRVLKNFSNRRGGIFESIISSPCFEVWVMLHYTDSDAPFDASNSRSECDNVIRKVKESLPTYEKSSRKLYEQLKPHTDTAIIRGKKLAIRNRKNGSTNPATDMHILVEYLLKLKP